MEQKSELLMKKIEFSKLHDKIRHECISKRTIEEIEELNDLYTEYENLYEDLKQNYGVDYTEKLLELGDFITRHANRLNERDNKLHQPNNNIESTQSGQNEVNNDEKTDSIDNLFNQLVVLITEENKNENINSTLNLIYDIDDLVKKIVRKAQTLGEEQQSLYINKVVNLGFKSLNDDILVVKEKLKQINKLIDEREDCKNLADLNEILSEYLNKEEKIREMIEDLKSEGKIIEKQEILFDIILEEYKSQMFQEKRK